MKFGIDDAQFKILENLVIKPLKKNGADVYIFGSRTGENFHSHSDVDLLFCTKSPIEESILSEIKENIENSNFPFTVDLVDAENLAQSYKDHVFKTRVQL